ncbi:microtubule-actin cross-linking factor 1, isoforms 1/2/3/5-like isoform X3 [Gigantopelta aegis]|uniref:microtubule-actin cross-linking factor 1, isoforms 1/2/3/5-like isoform X3 n=1 Tax=Gigantopelta aegis TaxID=1735272 RepID=UPI001B88A5BE|nr:microtubule-actin cross-linking factor 1, isoforms 1/2/3/5-like isoform X3 [Gigantopelta aegis]
MDKGAWETHKQYPQEDYDALPLCILQLDPADRAVIRIADERDAVQKKTFTKWVNKHLLKAGRRIVELYDDMRDGHNLISLLEVLSHEVLPRERGHMRFHKIQNVQICLDFLKMKGIRLVNIRSDEIVDGNPKLTLGLIWTIILHFQVSDVVVPGQPEHITARDALLLWSRRTVEGFPGVHIKDFSSSWRDGKAFLAIAHRHRPDLVDVRQAKQSSNKQNLETAFRLYEREFGVTRLLDPEDIDVQQPDERSVITYVSSLYDVFPEVPTVEQSLRDNERQLKTEEYQDLASSLLSWLMSTIGMLEQRDFPSTLIEIKKRLSDFNRFRLEEIPPRLETKQKLLRLFEEIQGLTADSSQTGINEELLPDNIIRLWNKFVAVQQEKDMAFQAEILRLERLQRLAEKIHREAKYNEDTLRDQEKRIGEEEARVDVVHPFEAKRSCDNIDRSLRTVEENLRGLFRDLHSLQDGKYPQADNLYKRISDIQSELSQLRTRLYSNVIQRLLSKSYVEEGKTTIRRTEVVTEVRMVETHPAFKHVQDCLDWIEEKQKQIEAAEYDSDLTQVELLIQTHHREHQEVVAFRREIDRCINDRRTLSEEEQKLYTQTLSKVEVAYSLLSNTSMRRQKCLESLYEFLQASTAELLWLSEKEELEIRRDWGSHQLSLADVEDQHKTLVRQLEDQESQFNAVQEKGGAMILDRHPASKVVEAYMATMQSQWSWLLQLTACLESHLRHSTSYFQFFEECHHCDQWIARQTDQLQNRYARDVVSSDEGQHMMRDLQAVQEQIKEYDRRVSSLVLRSTEILPIHQRSQPVQDSVRVRALCNCQQTEVSFQKGEECMLLDNSQHARWKVRTAVGLEAVIPSVCFIIPPPDPEAIEKANRLKLQIEHLQNSWKTQYRRLRLNMVLATIRLVKGWTLKQFMAMDPSQREAIWRALQDDAEKLLSRGVEGDADLIRLERELKECHQIFLQLSAEAAAEEARQMRTPSQDFLQQLDTINRNLSMCDQQLSTLLHKPVPNSRDSLTQATDNYDVFDNSLNACENSVLELQSSYLSVTPQTSQVESRLNLVVQKFDQLKAISHIYVQRLKNADLVVSGLEEVKQIVSDYEITLASHENMTSELKGLRNHKEELQDLQSSIQQQQPKIDTLKRDTATLRTLVENSRPGLTHHHDLDTIEKDVEDVGARWDNVCIQVVERLRSVDTAVDHASLYQNGLVGEQDWIDQMQARIETQAPLNGDVDQAKKLLEPSMSIYNSLGERRHQIESVNRHGGQYIREAKIHDKRLRQYRESLENVDFELITSVCKKVKHQDGAESVKVDLDSVNARYMEMVKWSSTRLKDITAILSQADVDVQFQMVIDDEIPLLRTFRAELAKRSSMLFDEDMEGFFHQLSEFEGYGSFSGSYYGAGDPPIIIKPGATATAEFSSERNTRVKHMDTSTVKLPSSGEQHLAQLSFALSQAETAAPKQSEQQTLITVKTSDVSSRGPALCASAIVNPQTHENLTLVEAIQTGLIDPVSETYVNPISRQRMPLREAVSQGLIADSLYKQLTSSSGIRDPRTNREVNVIEAVGRNLYNPVTNTVKDPHTGETVPLQEAVSRGLVSESCRSSLLGQTVSLTAITHTQALFSTSDLSKSEATLSLVQAIDKGLYDRAMGTITDPVTWKQMSILEAVESGRINASCCEIVDPDHGNSMSLTDAVKKGVIDPVSGVYIHKKTNKRIPLDEAVKRGLLHCPTSLLDVVVDGSLLEDGKVYDKTSGQTVSLVEAINSGQIDGDRKCIMNPRTNEMTSLRTAVESGLINSKGNYVSPDTHRQKTLLEALQQGDLKLVNEEISFSRSGVRDSSKNQTVSVAEALKRGIITKKGTYKDSKTGSEMTIKQAADRGFIDPSLVGLLNQKTGLVDRLGQHISILNAIAQEIIIPEEGVIKDVRTGQTHTFQYAATQGIITPDEAKDILELISPVITSTSILTRIHPSKHETVMRSITISEATSRGLLDDLTQRYTHPESGQSMSVEEAIEKGYLSLSSQWPDTSVFKTFDEVDTSSRTYKYTSETVSETKPVQSSVSAAAAASVESSFITKAGGSYSFTMTSVTRPSITQNMISETRRMTLKSVVDPKTGKEINITEAMKKGLIDLDAGTYRDPVTKSTMPLNIAVEKGYIIADLVSEPSADSGEPIKETRSFSITGVIHPKTGERLTVSRAIHDGILDQDRGVYHGLDKLGRPLMMPISEAIQKGFVIAEDITTTVLLPGSMLRETKTFMLKSVVHPLTGKILSVADAVEQGIIDESEGMYINPVTGVKITINEAIEKKFIDAELTSVTSDADVDVNKITTTKFSTLVVTAVVDPSTGRLITVHRAIEEGILDQANGIYYNPITKKSMQLSEAIDNNLVLVETTKSTDETDRSSITSIHITDEQESSDCILVEDIHTETMTLSISKVIDPRTMEMVSYNDAVLSGILNVNEGVYFNPATGETMAITTAMEKGLIHGEVTDKTREEELMRSSVVSEKPAFSLKMITSVIDPRTGKQISVGRAVREGLVDVDKGTFRDTRTGETIKLEHAFKQGFINPSKHSDVAQLEKSMDEEDAFESKVLCRKATDNENHWSLVEMELEKTTSEEPEESAVAREVLHYSTEIESHSPLDLSSDSLERKGESFFTPPKSAEPLGISYLVATKLGIIDLKTGKVRDPKTGKLMTLQQAIASGLIDQDKPAVCDRTGKMLSLRECLHRNLINPQTCQLEASRAKLEGLSQPQKIDKINLLDAFHNGLFNSQTGKIYDPASGKYYSLQEGLAKNMLDGAMVTVKDTQTGERVPLKRALVQGLIDGNQCLVWDKAANKRLPFGVAVEKGLVQNLFDDTTGNILDVHTGKFIPLDKALIEGKLKSTDVTVLDPKTGSKISLETALRRGLVDRSGDVLDSRTGEKMSADEALKMGLLAIVGAPILAGKMVVDSVKRRHGSKPKRPAEMVDSHVNGINGDVRQQDISKPRTTIVFARPGDQIQPTKPRQDFDQSDQLSEMVRDNDMGRLVDSYDKLFQELKTEISKVGDLERILKEDHQIGDEAYQVQSQLETQKAVHEDILSHQQRILSLVFQAEQLTENYQEELTPEQVTEIQSLATSLKSSLDKVVKTSENRLKHLTTAAEEVVKFEDELGKMTSWLTLAENELDRQEECLRRFEDFKPLAEKQKTLVADVMSHQAELRFMSLTSQKFLEEAKLHKLEVDSFKSDRQRPARLSLISMEGLAAEGVRDGLKDATTRYHDLKNNCNTFGDKLADLAAKQREYNDVAFKMLSWLTNSEDRLMSIKQDSGSPDPEILEQQLNKLKALGSEAIGQGTVIDDLQHKGQDLTKTLRGISADPIQVQKMEDTMTEITDRHLSLQTDISEQTNALQASITKSQGVHEAVDGLLSWLDKTDQTLRNLQPVSLNRDGLNRQYQDFQTVSSDVDHHKASIGSVQQTAHDLIKTCDLEMARSLELRLDDVDKRYREVQEKCRTRNKDLEEVSDKLRNFQNLKDEHNSWMQTAIDKLDSKELGKLPSDEMKNEIDAIMKEKQQRQGAIADLKRIGNELVKDPRTGDVSSLKDGLIGVERNWNQLVQLLDEKEREADLKEKQGNEFENAKNIMLLWLAAIEDRINCFDPVAIEIDIVEKQISELEPMLEEYEEQGAKVDEVNDLGNGLEALQSSDRPLSPIRRFGRLGSRRLLSPRLRTPSPTFPASPSSESSGISSRKSSSDNFLLDDLSETQQQLLDINQRYDIVGERLADRQQELQNVLSSIKTFLQDLQDMLSWLDIKDQETNANQSVPTSEKEAKRKLKDHEKFHHELVGKEGLVEDIRKKAQHLLRTRQGVKGLDSLQQQLTDLDDKWHGLRASSEQKRKMLEDVVTDLQNLRENGEQLTKWLSQKEKMMDVLGPVAVEPSLVQNQRDQVKVLQEEMASQEPLYDQFFQAGHSILDKCEPDSRDSASVSRKLESVGKSWDRLQARLKDRESNLKAMESMGSDFSDVTQKLGDKLNKLSTSLESLAPVNPCPGGQKLQAKEMMTLEEELSEIMPLMARAKELSKQLCDKTKDSATKAETRSKLARLEKSFGDAKKKLDNRKSTLDSAGKAGEKFACDCEETLGWVKDAIRQIREGEPVSGDAGALRQQAQQHKGIQQDIASREPDIRELLDNGSKILEDTVPSHETQQLLDMLETIQSDWDYLRDVARTKDDKLARTMAHAEKYHENLDKMLLWLQLSEDKLKKAQPQEWNKDAVGKTLKELQALQKDVLKKTHDHDNLNREGEALIGCVEDGQPEIEQQLKSINERWEDLNSEMGERTVGLEDLQQRLVEISDNINDANGCLRKWDDKLQTHLSMGAISKDPKYFDKIKSIQEDVSGLQSQLDYLEALTDGIDVDVVDAPGPSGLHDDVSAIKNKQQDLQGKLGELLSEMETGSQVVDEFQNLVKSVGNDLSDMEDELNRKEPVARDDYMLDSQKDEIQDFLTRLGDKSDDLVQVENKGRELVRAGYVTDPKKLQSQIDGLAKQHERLAGRANQRKADIQGSKKKVEKLNSDLKKTRDRIETAAKEIDSFKPVGGQVKAIQQEQAVLKDFIKRKVDPLQKQFETVSAEGQSFVQSAPSGVDTSEMESDLEVLGDKWSELTQKVSEREQNLASAFIHSGKFNEALDSLLSWLAETEDLVANQKPPSPEHKVVKAQLQEQKFLQKMLVDRAPSVQSVQESAAKLESNLDPAEKRKAQNQMKELASRWDALNKKGSDRMNTLEEVLVLAKDFQDIHDPMLTWLDEKEKKFASLEPKTLDTEGIKKLVKDLKALEKTIDDQDDTVRDIAVKGKGLQDYCKGEDVVHVQMKIDNVQKRYCDLKNKVEDTLEQMEEALPLAQRFQDAHEKLVDWIAKVEPEVRSKDVTCPEAEEHVQSLLDKVEEIQPLLEVLTLEGSELADLAPGDTGLRVEDLISKDNKKFEDLKDQVNKLAEKVQLSRQKSSEVIAELDDLVEWFDEEEGKLLDSDPISSNSSKLQGQLAQQKAINDDINSQKAKARDAIAMGKKLMRENSLENETPIREKMDALKQKADAVSRMSNDRLGKLEQALPLAKHFADTHEDLVSWLEEMEPALAELEVMTINADQVKKQQERIKALKQDVVDHKPTVDRLNKTGAALLQLCGEHDAEKVQKTLDDDNSRIEKVRSGVRDRSNSIDEALQQSADFSDKLEDMVENLTATSEQVANAEPISAHPDKLREQIAENKNIVEDMQMREAALESVRSTAEELLKQAGDYDDEAVKDVKQKLDELLKLYADIQNNTDARGRNLEDTLEVSEKFWDDLNSLMGTLTDLQENVAGHEPPAIEPEAIREQQEELEALKEDLQATQADLEDTHNTGDQLISLVGETDKPEVQKNIDDLDSNMANLTEEYEKRAKSLKEALTKSLKFQDQLMKLLVWLQKKEERLCDLEPIGTDFETIKDQWHELKTFKAEVEPKQVEIEALNHQANELAKETTADQAAVVKEPMAEVNTRWDQFMGGINERQRLLQLALLNIGQLDHAIKEQMSWLGKTDKTLDDIVPVYGDPRMVEIELAKLKVIENDIKAHQPSFDSINDEAHKVMASGGVAEAQGLRQKLNDLNNNFDEVCEKAAGKKAELEGALQEAQDFSNELQDVLMALGEVDGQLITSKLVGGLPETAKEQLEKFMEVYADLETLHPRIQETVNKGENLAYKTTDPAAENLRGNLNALQQRWNHVKGRADDRKKKLEDAENLAANFHVELNKFIGWLTDTEKTLNNLEPVSRLVDKVTAQIDDHRALQKNVSKHREAMIALDKMGTHLKYFSQKQDVILIKNLLSSVQHRWEKIVSRSAERTRHLERGFKEAKQFNDMWGDLIDWLKEAEIAVNADQFIANEPDKIKAQIAKHKEFQKKLGSKQPKFDTVNRTGRVLKERCPPEDGPVIQQMLNDLKTRWNNICGKSVDRQRKLEEALLFSGQFNEAFQALLDWLAKVEPLLSEDQPVHGDLDTVNSLIDGHKTFQQELGARTNTVQFVRKSAKELIEKSTEDTSQLQAQLIELSTMWDRTCRLSVSKQERLEQAHKLAEEFHKKAHGLLDWLGDAERQLRYRGPVPDEELLILQQIEDHKKFEESLLRQEANLRETLNIGQEIMKLCHPDAVSTMKHWLSVLRARWEELTGMCKHRGRRLAEGLKNVRNNNTLLDELLAWLNGAEVKLTTLDSEPIPQDAQIITKLINDHQDFQNEMSSKQPEVDRLTKPEKRRPSSTSSDIVSHIPVLRGTPKIPIRHKLDVGGRQTPDHGLRRIPDMTGRRTPDMSGRRTPDMSGRRTPDMSGRHTPDYSGRRTPDHSSGHRTPEPQFRNPRVGALFNKWRQVWLMAMDRQRKLQDALDYLNEVERMKNFDFDDWRRRYLRWMHHNKARIMDFFRRQDRDRDGRVTRKEFIDGILISKFPTSKLEMEAVANIFDKDGDGFINYKEFVAALRPDREPAEPATDADKIQDEVKRQCNKCTCMRQFKIHKIGEGKYRFGDSQKLRLVRILRSTVMVRVGGGWIALDEFLVKNDPCREFTKMNTSFGSKGRTNIELREQFILAEGVSQSMTGFVSKSPAGSSHSGSSTHSANNSWSSRSQGSSSGPITKVCCCNHISHHRQIREKTQHSSPWRQRVKTSPDGEVQQILTADPKGYRMSNVRSPGNLYSPASRSSSRASTGGGSRPASRTGSDAGSEASESDVFSTHTADSRGSGSRSNTPAKGGSRIPRITPKKK